MSLSTAPPHEQIGVVLAGGLSQRMQRPKQALRFQGRSWAEHACELLTSTSPACSRVVVSGYDVQGFQTIADCRPGLGPLGGLYAVCSYLRRSAPSNTGVRLLVLPVDMPLLSKACLDYLLTMASTDQSTAFYYLRSYFPCLIPLSEKTFELLSAIVLASTPSPGNRSLGRFFALLGAQPLAWGQQDELENFNTIDAVMASPRTRQPEQLC